MKYSSLLLALTISASSFAQAQSSHWVPCQMGSFPDTIVQIVSSAGPVLYAATKSEGVFRSTDEGENWTAINSGLTSLQISALTVGPHGELLALTKNGAAWFAQDGQNWKALYNTWYFRYPGSSVTAIAFDHQGIPYVGTVGAGIWRFDTVFSQIQIATPSQIPGATHMLFDDSDRLMVSYDQVYRLSKQQTALDHIWPGVSGMLLRSSWGPYLIGSDRHRNSDSIFEIHDTSLVGISLLAPYDLTVDSIGNLWTWHDGIGSWPYRSSDRGRTWTEWKNQGSPSSPLYTTEATSFGFFSADPNGTRLSVSFDSGWSFHEIDAMDTNLRIYSVAIDSNNNIQVTDQHLGLWSSSDHGVTWKRRMSHNPVYCSLYPDGRYYSTNLNGSNAWKVSDDNGITFRTFTAPTPPQGKAILFYVGNTGRLYAGCDSGYIMRSKDGGNTWDVLQQFDEGGSKKPQIFSILEKENYLYASSRMLHVTSDDGKNWATYPFGGRMQDGLGSDIFLPANQGTYWFHAGELPGQWDSVSKTAQIIIEEPDGTAVFAPNYQFVRSFHIARSGSVLDTLPLAPNNGSFQALALDSSGHLFSIIEGDQLRQSLYRLVSGSSGVHQTPNNSKLTASFDGTHLQISSYYKLSSLVIYDAAGREHFERSLSGNREVVDLAMLDKGIYFARVGSEHESIFLKILTTDRK